VRQALARIAPYRRTFSGDTAVRVPFKFVEHETGLGEFTLHRVVPDTRTPDRLIAQLDAGVVGLVVGARGARALNIPRLPAGGWTPFYIDISIGGRELRDVRVYVDTLQDREHLRMGLDVIWSLNPIFDARDSTMTLGVAPNAATFARRVEQIPYVLRFPGMMLARRPGTVWVDLTSASGRAEWRGRRWQIDGTNGVILVER
jgi:hypothetical protein